jgi:hypothetical protein
LNYTIPKNRQEAIEIFDKLVDNTINQPVDIIITKYYMFIGALTECSDEEFKKHIKYINCRSIICELCKYNNATEWCGHASSCAKVTKELFSKRWNE